MDNFRYVPLETPSAIRLVVLPATKELSADALPHLYILNVEISEFYKNYIALSYVWGNPSKNHTIRLNNKAFHVTDSLISFLRRRRDNQLAFWIDAICIDQENTDEKNQQIGRMREIYQSAHSIHADLGPATPAEESVFSKMPSFAQYITDGLRAKYEVDADGSISVKLLDKPSYELPPELEDPRNIHLRDTLSGFFDRPWWKRAWVMQEATALSKRLIYLLCGDVTVTLDAALWCAVAMLVNSYSGHWGVEYAATGTARHLLPVQQVILAQQRTVVSLLDILGVVDGLEASDPRDIVYSALNIANDIPRNGINLDYRASVVNVYKSVVAHYLTDSVEPLRSLSFTGPVKAAEIESGWPSWVPSWHHQILCVRLPTRVYMDDGAWEVSYHPFGLDSSMTQKHPAVIDGHILRVHGVLIDTLNAPSEHCRLESVQSQADSVNQWLPKDPSAPYITGETMSVAFSRTIVADVSTSAMEGDRRGGRGPCDPVSGCISVGQYETTLDPTLKYTAYRCLAYSKQGYMMLVGYGVEEGDLLYALVGGLALYVLRPKEEGLYLIAECYVHGLMDGEVMELVNRGQTQIAEIAII